MLRAVRARGARVDAGDERRAKDANMMRTESAAAEDMSAMAARVRRGQAQAGGGRRANGMVSAARTAMRSARARARGAPA